MTSTQPVDELIYVELLDEGSTCWRPVQAGVRIDGSYELRGFVQDGERWAFQPGDIVLCRWHTFSDGTEGRVAYQVP